MKTKYPILYQRHPTPPSIGDTLTWDGEGWKTTPSAFEDLIVSPDEATWSSGYKKRHTAGSNFQLNITNIVDGASGVLVLNVTTQLDVALNTGKTEIGNGSLTGLAVGRHLFQWVYDGERFMWKIELYA